MRALLKSALLGLSFLVPTSAIADASDRCTVRECTCTVYADSRPTIEVNNREVQRRHQVLFAENGSYINSGVEYSLVSFLRPFEGDTRYNITMIGYTDGCGSSEHNHNLASTRIDEVKTFIREHVPRAIITTVVAGENTLGHDPSARRVDVVVHTNSSLATRIDKIPADAYLIDASGSMWSSWREWEDVIGASVRPDSDVYVSMMRGCRSGQRLSSITPQGGTEIWYSYWYVLQQMKPGETLLGISDYDSNVPLTAGERETLRQLARRRQIDVISVR